MSQINFLLIPASADASLVASLVVVFTALRAFVFAYRASVFVSAPVAPPVIDSSELVLDPMSEFPRIGHVGNVLGKHRIPSRLFFLYSVLQTLARSVPSH